MSRRKEGKIRDNSNFISPQNSQLNIEKNYINQNCDNKRDHRENKKHNKINRNITHFRNYYLIFLLIDKIALIILNNNFYFLNLNNSFISLTIKGTGYKPVFANHREFETHNYPNETYINGDKQDSVNYNYYFNETYNNVKLIWYNNIIDPSHMFVGCSDITEIDLSHFNTSEVTEIRGMFTNCISLTSLNLSNFNTSSVKNMGYMFGDCQLLTSLDLSNFDTSLNTNMGQIFSNCKSLSYLNLSNFNMDIIEDIHLIFEGCTNLEYINLFNSNPNISNLKM
jgi:surface protein